MVKLVFPTPREAIQQKPHYSMHNLLLWVSLIRCIAQKIFRYALFGLQLAFILPFFSIGLLL